MYFKYYLPFEMIHFITLEIYHIMSSVIKARLTPIPP